MIRHLLVSGVLVGSCGLANALNIMDVRVDRTSFYPLKGETVAISCQLSEPAQLMLHIYDGRDVEVRRVLEKKVGAPLTREIHWDGRDELGVPVPPEAYRYVLTAKAPDGHEAVHDLSDVTGGADLKVAGVDWDAKTQELRYVLSEAARVNVRVGLRNNGPLMRTVVDWVARPAGAQHERWDGFDASRAIELGAHPALDISVSAFSLPHNTLFVMPLATTVKVIDIPASERKVRPSSAKAQPKRMFAHAQQALEDRGDFQVDLVLPSHLPMHDSVPNISGPTPIRVNVSEADRARVLGRRLEPVFFVDGQYVYENEVGYLPMTWVWDLVGTSPGIHYITVNLRGYEGNFGMATAKVRVVAP